MKVGFSGFGIRLPVGSFVVASESDCIVNEKYNYYICPSIAYINANITKLSENFFKMIFVAHIMMMGK